MIPQCHLFFAGLKFNDKIVQTMPNACQTQSHENTNQFEWHLFDICDQTILFMQSPGVKES